MAETIRVEMARQNLNNTQLSKMASVSINTVLRISSGDTHYNTKNLYKILNALKIQVD